MKKINLLIVDDQELIRDGLHDCFLLEEEIEVIGLASDGKAAIEFCEYHKPDLILMDIRMPVIDGVEATKQIKMKWPDIQIMILTTFREIEYVTEALKAGAEGYLLKGIEPEQLIKGVKLISYGGTLISKEIASLLIHQTERQVNQQAIKEYKLTEREIEVLRLVAEGLNNQEISSNLFLSQGTVKNYISTIYSKFDLHDRLKVAKKAMDERII